MWALKTSGKNQMHQDSCCCRVRLLVHSLGGGSSGGRMHVSTNQRTLDIFLNGVQPNEAIHFWATNMETATISVVLDPWY